MARGGAPAELPKRPYYCPFTKNKKFETFLDDLFELGFDVERNKQELIQYVSAIESYYTEKLRDVYLRKNNRSRSIDPQTQKVN